VFERGVGQISGGVGSRLPTTVGVRKLESLSYRIVRRCLRDPTFSRFGTIPAFDRQTDGRTDKQTVTHDDSIYRASIASRGKKSNSSKEKVRAIIP